MDNESKNQKRKLKVLFLGTNRSFFSIQILKTILAHPQCDVTVIAHDITDRGLIWAFRHCWKQLGPVQAITKAGRWTVIHLNSRLAHLKSYNCEPAMLRELLRQSGRCQTIESRNINRPETIQAIESLRPDLIIIGAFPQILRPAVFKAARLGAVNVHSSLLPKYRGPHPYYWILENKEQSSGVTLHFVDEGIDSGDIIFREEIPIAEGETEESLELKSVRVASVLVCRALNWLAEGRQLPRRAQEAGEATYYSFKPRLKTKRRS